MYAVLELDGPAGKFSIENDFVLAMTGYEPNYGLLQRLGLRCSEDEAMLPDHDAESLETHLPNVYVAGVVCGGRQTSKWFIENTRDHGERIIQQIVDRLGAGITP